MHAPAGECASSKCAQRGAAPQAGRIRVRAGERGVLRTGPAPRGPGGRTWWRPPPRPPPTARTSRGQGPPPASLRSARGAAGLHGEDAGEGESEEDEHEGAVESSHQRQHLGPQPRAPAPAQLT